MKATQVALCTGEELFRLTFDQAPIGAAIVGLNHGLQHVNKELCHILGFSEHELKSLKFTEFTHPDDIEKSIETVQRFFAGDVDQSHIEERYIRKDGKIIWGRLSIGMVRDTKGRPLHFLFMLEDITEHKLAENALTGFREQMTGMLESIGDGFISSDDQMTVQKLKQEIEERKAAENRVQASNVLLKLMSESTSRKAYLDRVLEYVLERTGCRYIGIRVLNEDGDIPYESYIGFTKEFWELENWLSLSHDNCICTRVISGKPEPQDIPLITPGGSFYCNDTKKFAEALSQEELGRFRGECIRRGFLSVTVIPIRYKSDLIGGIHLCDERAGILSLHAVQFLEAMAGLIGEAIHKFTIKDRLQQHYDTQELIYLLLQLSFTGMPLEELLSMALDRIISLPWLFLESTGAIFLVEENAKVLVMKAQKGLDERIKRECARVPLGKCLCGEAVRSGKMRFGDHAAQDEEGLYECPSSSIRYCVPIKISDRVLGVLSIFTQKEQRSNERNEKFLSAVASALAGIIRREELENALGTASLYARSLIEASLDPLVTISADGKIMDVNKATELATGISRDELVGSDFSDYFTQPEKAKEGYKRVFLEGSVRDYPLAIRHRTGSITEVLYNATLYRNEEGDVQGVFAAARDITERKQAEEALHRREQDFRALGENAPDVVSRFDRELCYSYINPAIERLTGIPSKFFTGKTTRELGLSDEVATLWEGALKGVFETGQDEVIEYEMSTPHGKAQLEARLVPEFTKHGSVESVLVVSRDITKRKQAEEDIKTYMKKLERSNRDLQDFAFIASHDLQEPLRKIQAFGEMVLTKYNEILGNDGKDYLVRMQNAANRMQTLINDLLRYSRVTTEFKPMTPLDLNILVKEIIGDLAHSIEKTGGSVEFSDLPTIEADKTQMHLLFQNLIGNAIKFHGEEKPLIKIYSSNRIIDVCEIFIEDNGIGFDERYLDRIFAPFQRLHGRSAYEGTGMGLAICRKIVERHGGNITARSAPGKGSTFIVTLPLRHSM
jgi:PAS domain S-box-containing protein